MPARAFVAAFIAIALLAGGAYYTLGAKDAGIDDVLAILMREEGHGGLLCAIAAWGSIAAAMLGVISAFAAFFEEEDDDGYRRRGFPKVIPLVLIIVGLVLFWAMFDCAARDEAPPPVAISTPAPPPVELAPAEPDPAPPAAPEIDVDLAAYDWPYMIPLIRGSGYDASSDLSRALAAIFPASDADGRVRAALCGAAWVMVSGAASEEGPRARNETRSRIRAELAAGAARRWVEAHTDDCQAPIILTVDLGQHQPTSPPVRGDGSDTGFQRAVIVVSRMRRSPEEAVTASEALGEAQGLLDDPDQLRSMLAGRDYAAPPGVFQPAGGVALD